MYARLPNQDAPLSQGDIINNVVLAYIPDISNPAFVVGDEYVEKDLTLPFGRDDAITVVAEALKAPVLVIEPNCNIDYDDFISVARIFPLNDRHYNEIPDRRPQKKAKYLARNYQHVGAQPAVYYLQEAPDVEFPKSFASLLELHTIRRNAENLAYLQRNRMLRLTEEAIGDLQYRIGFFFGRYSVVTDNYMLTPEEKAALTAGETTTAAE